MLRSLVGSEMCIRDSLDADQLPRRARGEIHGVATVEQAHLDTVGASPGLSLIHI